MIKGLASKYISKAFSGHLSDTVNAFTGERVGKDVRYDVDTDTLVYNSVNYSGRGVFGSYTNFEIDGSNVRLNDVKLLCLQVEIDSKPLIGDVIVSDGKEYRIIDVKADPAEVTWSIQLRGLSVE